VAKDPKIKVGQLWRRRHDGKAFIPAVRSPKGDGWLDRKGHKRTEEELYKRYVLVAIDGTASKRSKKKG
jgi:hypothetical protein